MSAAVVPEAKLLARTVHGPALPLMLRPPDRAEGFCVVLVEDSRACEARLARSRCACEELLRLLAGRNGFLLEGLEVVEEERWRC